MCVHVLARGLGLSILALVALGCGGGGGGGDASAQPDPDVAETPGDEGTGDPSDPGTPPEGSQGECTGDNGVSATGDYVIQGPSAVLTVNHLDVVSVTATHKVDIDLADQCLSSIEIVLSTLFEGTPACRLTLRGDSSSDDDPSQIVLLGTFEADSFCQGFPDVDEGTYTGYAGTAEVDASFLGAGNQICVQTQVSIDLHGSLTKAGDDTRLIVFDSTDFEISGDISSSGATHYPCMAGYSGPDPTLACAPNLQRSCPCGGGQPDGTQTCLADGSGWTTCTCDEPTPPEPDDCASNPCKNGGTCIEIDGGAYYICECPEGYVGETCEIDCAKPAPYGWACNPYCQLGCPDGQGCTFAQTVMADELFPGCYPTGMGDMGQACSGSSCQAGHACLQFDEEPLPTCRRFCITDADCGENRTCTLGACTSEYCDVTLCSDPAPSCFPDCEGSECGDDGCGGVCGTCQDGTVCEAGECVTGPCVPDCADKVCGPDGCGGSCGQCQEGFSCLFDGTCTGGSGCTASCDEKECGSDGCGGSCGQCPEGTSCHFLGYCVDPGNCSPSCANKVCGPDGCGGSCGDCPFDYVCGEDGLFCCCP